MKAMIFAAGLGTRLKPFTINHPKALVPVGGVPMLERVITNLRDNTGISSFVINVHHFASQIFDFIKLKKNFGVDIAISDETDCLLDTGGGVLAAKKMLLDGSGEPILIHNADILSTVDINEMRRQHEITCSDVTLLATERATQRYFCFDKSNNRLVGWTNLATGETRPSSMEISGAFKLLAFGGIHIISAKVFDNLESYTQQLKFSITPFYIDSCNTLDIRCYSPDNRDFKWFDVGKNESLESADAWIRTIEK